MEQEGSNFYFHSVLTDKKSQTWGKLTEETSASFPAAGAGAAAATAAAASCAAAFIAAAFRSSRLACRVEK